MMRRSSTLPIHFLLFFILSFRSTPSDSHRSPFIYNPVKSLHRSQDVSLLGDSNIDTSKILQLTPDSGSTNRTLRLNKVGRFMLKQRFELWEEAVDVIVSFISSFLVNVFVREGERSGEGFAFVIAPAIDLPTHSYGEWLGLTNATLDGNSTNKFVAIELDTKKQEYDIDDNHIGLNINGVKGNKSVSFGIQLAPVNINVKYRVWVDYNVMGKLLEAFIASENENGTSKPKPTDPVLREFIDLKKYVNQYSYLGFSAATGDDVGQFNCVLEWNLKMELLHEDKSSWWKVVVGIVVPVLVFVMDGVVVRVVY